MTILLVFQPQLPPDFFSYPFNIQANRRVVIFAEGVMPLGKITKRHHNNGNQYFRHGWVDAHFFYKKFYKKNVHANTDGHNGKITKQLYPAPQGGTGKGDVFLQQEPHGKATAKGN